MPAPEWADPGSFLQYDGLGIKCPKCQSEDIIFEEQVKSLSFFECKRCGYKKG